MRDGERVIGETLRGSCSGEEARGNAVIKNPEENPPGDASDKVTDVLRAPKGEGTLIGFDSCFIGGEFALVLGECCLAGVLVGVGAAGNSGVRCG